MKVRSPLARGRLIAAFRSCGLAVGAVTARTSVTVAGLEATGSQRSQDHRQLCKATIGSSGRRLWCGNGSGPDRRSPADRPPWHIPASPREGSGLCPECHGVQEIEHQVGNKTTAKSGITAPSARRPWPQPWNRVTAATTRTPIRLTIPSKPRSRAVWRKRLWAAARAHYVARRRRGRADR